MNEIIAIFTCYNRITKTKSVIEQLALQNEHISFLVVDDASSDGTPEMLEELKKEYDIVVLHGNGHLFYSGGMRMGMQYLIDNSIDCKYIILMNDDINLYEDSLSDMILQSSEQNNAVIVGEFKNQFDQLSYGAVKYIEKSKYRKMDVLESMVEADTFNANFVLIPHEAFVSAGAIDKHYVHSLGDFDYGLMLKRSGWHIYPSRNWVGRCDNNSKENTWEDSSLKIKDRIKKKESPKGSPFKPWFYYNMKNCGVLLAIKMSITPYIRIILKR